LTNLFLDFGNLEIDNLIIEPSSYVNSLKEK
jgi:hypothetical protein